MTIIIGKCFFRTKLFVDNPRVCDGYYIQPLTVSRTLNRIITYLTGLPTALWQNFPQKNFIHHFSFGKKEKSQIVRLQNKMYL